MVVLCVALWLLTAGLFSCYVPFVVLLLCLVDSVWHYDHPIGEEGPGYFHFLKFVA